MPDTSTLDIEINLEKALTDLRKLNQGLDRTEKEGKSAAKSVKKTGDEAEKASSGFGSLKAAVAGVFTASALSGFTRTVASFQSLENSLGVVFQSMDRGSAVFRDIQNLAQSTPLAVDDLTSSVIKLRASGIEPTVEQLTLFSDVASVTGDTVGSLTAITDLFARTTAGGLGLEDLNRLADRGIPVFTILSEKLGVSRLEISELGKSAEGAQQLLGALTEGLEERFGGASAQAASLLNTQISNLGDSWDRFLVTLGDAGGIELMNLALSSASSTIQFFTENLDTLAVGLTGLATLAIPAVITGVKALTAALLANPIGLIVVAVTAAVTALYHFRGVIFDTLVKAWEVWVPNAIDSTLVAFLKIDRGILHVVNSVLSGISSLGNKLITETPDWLKGWLGIDGYEFDLTISTTNFDNAISMLEDRIANRIKNFKAPPRPDFLGLEDGTVDDFGSGLATGPTTGITNSSDSGDEQGAALLTKENERLLQRSDLIETSLLTEEERLLESYGRRQDMVLTAYDNELIEEEKRNEILLGLREQFEADMNQITLKGLSQREKFMLLSTKGQTKQVLGELLNMTAGVAQHNKELFRINQVAGAANAVINAYEGASETLSAYPQPLAGILAAGHLAAGLATVDAIRNTSFEGGGGGTIPSGATGTGPVKNEDLIAPIDTTPQDQPNQITIKVLGEFTSSGFELAVIDAVENASSNDEIRIINAS